MGYYHKFAGGNYWTLRVKLDFGFDIVPILSLEHITGIIKEANYLLDSVTVPLKYMDKEMSSRIFTVYIILRLEYAPPVWLTHLRTHTDLMQRVQRRATMKVSDSKELSYRERNTAMNLLTLDEIRKVEKSV